MGTNYTTKTAALKATKADINKIDAKKMLLNGKNILDYIKDSEFNSYDTRDPQLKNDELDIWNTEISLSEEGHIEVKPLEHTIQSLSSNIRYHIGTCAKVIDNEVLGDNDEHIMYWQTDGLTDGYGLGDDIIGNSGIASSFTQNILIFSSDLPKLTDGIWMFSGCRNLSTFSSDLSSLTDGTCMFENCNKLTSFSSDLSSLENGHDMFMGTALTSFSSDLSSLTDGTRMFYNCSALTSFSSDLSSLTNSNNMFTKCSALTAFNVDLPSLTDAYRMFASCSQLKSFSSDLSSLTYSKYMFDGCTNLTTFVSDLSSLTQGEAMFSGCKLDAPSVANIVYTLPTRETLGSIGIGIGCNNTEEDKLLFAQECDCDTWQEIFDEFSAKNWNVYFQFNGRPTSTYNMRRGETLPIYTKLVEVIMPTDENESKPHYAYTSQDGSKFFNINYFHSTNGSTEGYDVFSSLEEAINSYGVTPKN